MLLPFQFSTFSQRFASAKETSMADHITSPADNIIHYLASNAVQLFFIPGFGLDY